MSDFLKGADYVTLLASGIPLVIEVATLVRVIRGSNNRFATRILVMLIAYNVINLGEEIVYLTSPVKLKINSYLIAWFICSY